MSYLIGGGGGASDILGLSDTPSSYSGEANKVLKVNPGETAMTFEIDSVGTGSIPDFSTSEQAWGPKWTGGETIYQKTVTFTMSATSPTTVAHGITGMTQLLFYHGAVERNTNQWVEVGGTAHPSVQSDQILVTVDTTNVVLADAGSQWDSNPGHITLYYLK